MTSPVTCVRYGPHTFGNPEHYLKTSSNTSIAAAHDNLQQTLVHAFCGQDGSIPHQEHEPLGETTLDFINYGDIQLVYRATLPTGKEVVALINQPRTSLGQVREEFDNLRRLAKIDPNFVVTPSSYFQHGNHELFAAPYMKHAMCIYADRSQGWGVFDPVPRYHFQPFCQAIADSVIESMVALLINYFDEQAGAGIAKTRLCGDDFILTRGFQKTKRLTVLPHMKLIACRGMVSGSLDEYIDLVKSEFRDGTRYTDECVLNGTIKVNHKSAFPFRQETINKGIALGLAMKHGRK